MLSTRPRFCAWRANSLWLQWLIGSPLASGGSQAKAMIEQIWAGVKVAGAPGRGLSASRSPALAAADPASQRRRQRLTVLRHTPSRSAAALTPTPSPAKRMMRARNAICCGVDRARTRLSSCAFSSALKTIAGAIGCAIVTSRGWISTTPPNLTRHQMTTESHFPLR